MIDIDVNVYKETYFVSVQTVLSQKDISKITLLQ